MIKFRQTMLDQNYLNPSYDHYHQRLINSFMESKIIEVDQPTA